MKLKKISEEGAHVFICFNKSFGQSILQPLSDIGNGLPAPRLTHFIYSHTTHTHTHTTHTFTHTLHTHTYLTHTTHTLTHTSYTHHMHTHTHRVCHDKRVPRQAILGNVAYCIPGLMFPKTGYQLKALGSPARDTLFNWVFLKLI